MNQPRPLDHLLGLPAYHVAESAVASANLIRLSFNEGAFGPSPLALAAYQNAAANLHRYPDLNYAALRQAIAACNGLEVSRIVCGAGSDDLLNLLARGYAHAGNEIIYSQYGFSMYGIVTKLVGATPVVIPEKNYTLDIDALLAAVTPRTRIVFVANPNNPTGTYINRDALYRLHAGLPRNVLLFKSGHLLQETQLDAMMNVRGYLVAKGSVSSIYRHQQQEWQFVAISRGHGKCSSIIELSADLPTVEGVESCRLSRARN
jgi:histidinol-phosphate aminotransferase